MSRQELAEAVAAWLFEHAGREFCIDATYVGKLERGEHRWPTAHYRNALRAVLGRDTDAELGFFIIQGHARDAAPDPPSEPDASGETGDGGAAGPGGRTLLHALLLARHWQVYRTFRAQFVRAARALADHDGDRSVAMLDVSQRQFHRWLGGARPRPDACRVLESMFGQPVGRLLGPARSGTEMPGADSAAPVASLAGADADVAVRDGSAEAVRVSVNATAGTAVTVVCHDGAPGRVAVVAGGVRVLIDASGTGPAAALGPAVLDVPAVSGGARVYSLAERRAR
jgi:hypothetical protein